MTLEDFWYTHRFLVLLLESSQQWGGPHTTFLSKLCLAVAGKGEVEENLTIFFPGETNIIDRHHFWP